MRKAICVLVLLFLAVSAIGCEKQADRQADGRNDVWRIALSKIREEAKDRDALDAKAKNLDLSKAKITIPEVNEVEEVVFPVSTDPLERQIEKFEDDIYRYTGKDRDADLTAFMYVVYWDAESNDWPEIPYAEATEEQWEEIGWLTYNDGTYSASLIFSDYMLEMGRYDEVTGLTGDTEDYAAKTFGYLGMNLGSLVKTFRIPQDDISDVVYPLADGDCALSDAVAFVEKQIKEDHYYFVDSDYLDYRVYEAEVRRLNDTVYYYQFRVCAVYQGVPLNYEDSMQTEESGSEDKDQLSPFTSKHTISMYRSGQLGFIYSSCHSYEAMETQQCYTELISLSDACSLLSEYLTEASTFSVASIELVYQTEFTYEDEEKRARGYIQSVRAHPAYRFTMTDPHTPEYENLYFDVDALTGDIVTMFGAW